MLLDPSSWDDTNDSHYLGEYKRLNGLGTVLALCLSAAPETYHQWRVFAGHPAGVCVRFNRGDLLKSLRGLTGITISKVQYLTVPKARSKKLNIEDLPFVKRSPYVDEREMRILFESASMVRSEHDIPIPLTCISRITLSPWLPRSLFPATRDLLRSFKDCAHIEVYRSSIIDNEEYSAPYVNGNNIRHETQLFATTF